MAALQTAGYNRVLHSFPANDRRLADLGVKWFVSEQGIVEIANPVKPPMPVNAPPEGLLAGAIVSLIGLALCAMAARRRVDVN